MSDPEPRFYIIEITGQTIKTDHTRGHWGTSYSVLDRLQGHQEVYSRHCTVAPWGKVRSAGRRRRQVERECARLNNLDRETYGELFGYTCQGCLKTVWLDRAEYHDRADIIQCHDCTEAT